MKEARLLPPGAVEALRMTRTRTVPWLRSHELGQLYINAIMMTSYTSLCVQSCRVTLLPLVSPNGNKHPDAVDLFFFFLFF